MKEASWEEAERHLRFAEAHASEVPDHHLQLGRLYQDRDRPDLAELEVGHVLELEARSPMELEVRLEALEMRKELGGT